MISRKINSVVKDFDIIANLKELHSNFVFVPIDKAANVAIICKGLYTLVMMKELGSNSRNNDNNGTYEKINSIMKNHLINEDRTF